MYEEFGGGGRVRIWENVDRKNIWAFADIYWFL